MLLTAEGDVKEWIYHAPSEFEKEIEGPDTFDAPTDNVKVLNTPITEEMARSLHVGDVVLINGTIFTGRDAVHKYLHEGGELDIINGGIIYHCGPVVLEKESGYQVMAAGPTTSIREEPYQHEVIKKFDIKAVIGKGGMGAKTLKACQEHGSVYLHGIGGAAQVYALTVKSVDSVHLEEFGSPEAVWELTVEGFPAVVTMDSHGNSLHDDVEQVANDKFKKLLQ
jgi:fumarate hydratase class I